MKKRGYLMKVERSRKGYFFVYVMDLMIIALLIFLYVKGYNINNLPTIISFSFICLSVLFIEIHRKKDWWGVTKNSLVQSLGILNKNVRELNFSSISDLDLDQPFFKRILNYGDINVRLFLNETSINIKNINRPEEFMERLRDAMFSYEKESPHNKIKI